MIKVESRHSDDRFDLTVKGHAESAPYGEDLICAAASILFYTACKAARDILPNVHIKEHISAGDASLTVSIDDTSREKAETLAAVIEKGYQILQNEYPQNIGITVFFNPSRSRKEQKGRQDGKKKSI